MMLQAVMLLIIYGTVIGSGGNVYVLNGNLKPITFKPSNGQLNDSLKIGGNVVGISYIPNQKTFLILKFSKSNSGNTIFTYTVKDAKNPVRLKIYMSEDGSKWRFVKDEVATEGTHDIILKDIESKSFYIKILCHNALKAGHGTSIIDAIYITVRKVGMSDKIDLNTMQVYLNGMWMPLAGLVTEFLATTIGVATFVDDRRLVMVSSILFFVVVFVLSFVFDLNLMPLMYLFNSVATMVVNAFIYGIAVGFVFSKILKK